jgi:hypothetical protein
MEIEGGGPDDSGGMRGGTVRESRSIGRREIASQGVESNRSSRQEFGIIGDDTLLVKFERPAAVWQLIYGLISMLRAISRSRRKSTQSGTPDCVS